MSDAFSRNMNTKTEYISIPEDELGITQEELKRKGVKSETYYGLDRQSYLKFKNKKIAKDAEELLK